jgi:Flp pilus assembly protein TadB
VYANADRLHDRCSRRLEGDLGTLPSIARQPDFNLLIANRTPDEIDRLTARSRGSVLRAGSLYVRVKDGRIRARCSSRSRFASYPTLRGQLQRSGSGTRIIGRMHWLLEHIFFAIFWFATALMTTVAIVAASTAGAANPAFIVCAPGALLLGAITVMNQAMRRAKRKRETDQLAAALRLALQDGEV